MGVAWEWGAQYCRSLEFTFSFWDNLTIRWKKTVGFPATKTSRNVTTASFLPLEHLKSFSGSQKKVSNNFSVSWSVWKMTMWAVTKTLLMYVVYVGDEKLPSCITGLFHRPFIFFPGPGTVFNQPPFWGDIFPWNMTRISRRFFKVAFEFSLLLFFFRTVFEVNLQETYPVGFFISYYAASFAGNTMAAIITEVRQFFFNCRILLRPRQSGGNFAVFSAVQQKLGWYLWFRGWDVS